MWVRAVKKKYILSIEAGQHLACVVYTGQIALALHGRKTATLPKVLRAHEGLTGALMQLHAAGGSLKSII